MKHWLSISILAGGLSLLALAVQAQGPANAGPVPGAPASQAPGACRNWDLWALRGTYAFTATAWQDLSQLNPALPKGYAPVTIVGAFKVNGSGEVTGWGVINAGGLHMTAEFVNSQFGPPRADCSIPISLSMKMPEFGEGIAGPYPYVGVIAGDASRLEIAFMMLGAGPGSHVEMNHARRISMAFD
jgi:hypothetical protein